MTPESEFQVLPQRSDVPRRSTERGEAEKEEDAAAAAQEEEEEQEKPSRGGESREGLQGDGRHRWE